MLDLLLSPAAFVIVLLVFGTAPGLVLRLIVLAFPADDPRREELLAELYAVPRYERPLWVAEQIEIAISEGLWGRLVWAASGRIIYRWHLRSGVESHEKFPETFWIPPAEIKAAIEPGYSVRLAFDVRGVGGERMWVRVTGVEGDQLVGELKNSPLGIPRLYMGDEIKFNRDHILDVHPPDWEADDSVEPILMPICPCCAETWNEPEGPVLEET
jgi:hypothetical protein